MRLISVAHVLSIILLTASSFLAADQPPNVVLIFADDLVYPHGVWTQVDVDWDCV